MITGETKDGKIILDDVLIPKQEVSHSSVDISASDVVGLIREFPEASNRIIGHWHSHNSMGCFFSSTDEENMDTIMENRDFFVFIVSSKDGNLVRIDMRKPFPIRIDGVETAVVGDNDEELKREVLNEINKKVKEKWAFETERYSENKIKFGFSKRKKKLWLNTPNSVYNRVKWGIRELGLTPSDEKKTRNGWQIEIENIDEDMKEALIYRIENHYEDEYYYKGGRDTAIQTHLG